MTYELSVFDSKLKDISDLLLLSDAHINPDKLALWKHRITEEVNRVKDSLTHKVFSIEKECVLERYIQHHQTRIIHLCDLAFKRELEQNTIQLNIYPIQESILEAYFGHLYESLISLLSYIEKHFSKYFDQDSTIPDAYRKMTKSDLRSALPVLKEKLVGKGVSNQLQEVLLHPMSAFLSGRKSASFRSLIYMKAYISEVEDLINSEHRGLAFEKEVIRLSLYLNFNSYKCFSFICSKITIHALAKGSIARQIEAYMKFSKVVYHAPEKPGMIYNSERVPLKSYLLDWIQSEIKFLESKHQLSLNLTIAPKQETNKFQVTLSVAQLGFALRTLVENDIIKTKNNTELIRFFAQHFKTPFSDSISEDSLRNRYYNSETGTAVSMEKLLNRLLAYTKEKC